MGPSEAVRRVIGQIGQVQIPVCPWMRLARKETGYAIDGYCVLDQSPGWFMIPSIEEFDTYCTGAQFHRCPWFNRGQADRAAPKGQSQRNTHPEVWEPPDYARSKPNWCTPSR